jgi:hypothetical protein
MTGLEVVLVRLTLPTMRYLSSAFSHIRKANGVGASHSVQNCAPNKHYLEIEVPGARDQAPSRFHHFQPGIEFMSATRTVDHIRLDTQLVRPDPHAFAIRAPSELDLLIVQGLVLHAT